MLISGDVLNLQTQSARACGLCNDSTRWPLMTDVMLVAGPSYFANSFLEAPACTALDGPHKSDEFIGLHHFIANVGPGRDAASSVATCVYRRSHDGTRV